MPEYRLLKRILSFTFLTALFLALTCTSFAIDKKRRAGEVRGTGHLHNSPPADTTAWIDSLKRVIAKKYTWGSGGTAALKSQKRYILANTTLADYYARKFYAGDYAALAPAEKYYGNVAVLTDGTDGDLSDDISVLKMRDSGAKKLMRLYLSLKLTPAYQQKLYRLVRSQAGVLRNESAATRDKVSRFLFRSTGRFFPDPSLVPEDGEGICSFVNPVYRLSLKTPPAKFSQFDSLAALLKTNPQLRLKVAARSSLMTMREQQLLWEITNFVISYMVEKQGISAERFLFVYDINDKAGPKFKGLENMPVLTLSFAAEGEEGPSMVPAPLPHLRQ